MAFMKFVIKTLVVAKHNLLAGLLACVLVPLLSRTIGLVESAWTDLG